MCIETRVAVVLTAASLLAAGCGSGSTNSNSPTSTASQTPVSKAQYAAAVHRICHKQNQQEDALDLSSISAFAKNGDRGVEIERERADQVARIKTPSRVEAAANSFLDQLRTRADKMQKMTDAAKEHDSDKFFVARVGLQALFAGILKDEYAIGMYCFRSKPS